MSEIYQPFNYQVHAGQHMRNTPYGGLFLDMGLGKTVIALTELDYMLNYDLSINRPLVIGPKNVVRSVWKQEAAKWEHLKHLKVSIVWGTLRERIAALKTKADIYVINRENVSWLVGLFKTGWPFDYIVVDELSSFKSHASQRFKNLKIIRPYIKGLVGLTGTPSPNGLLDLWSQVYLMDQGERLEKTITGYRERYFIAKTVEGFVSKYVPRKEAAQAIYNKIGDICISMKSEDYLDLPELIQNDIYLEMNSHTQQQYDQFQEEQLLQLANTEITALSAAALTNKLLQFSNGAMYHSDKSGDYTVMHDEKLNALEDIIDEAQGNPVLIFYTFRHDAERIMKRFPKVRWLKGDKDITDWNEGKIDLLMAHPASAGHGLNLQQGGHIMVWFGLNWSLELYLQAIKRIHRLGQVHTVIMHRLLMEHTLDLRVSNALLQKDRGQESLLEAIKAMVDETMKKRGMLYTTAH